MTKSTVKPKKTTRKKTAPADAREHLVGVRLSSEELGRLDVLADHYGLSRVNALRLLVKRAHDEYSTRGSRGEKRGGSLPPKRRPWRNRGSQVS